MPTEEQVMEQVNTTDRPVEKEVDYTKETVTFPFKWEAPNGDVFEGQLTNHVLTVGDIGRVASAVARLNDGQPYNSIPPLHRDLNDRLGHLMVSLSNEKDARPPWARNLLSIVHGDLVYMLYRVVETHEAIFRGYGKAEKAGD